MLSYKIGASEGKMTRTLIKNYVMPSAGWSIGTPHALRSVLWGPDPRADGRHDHMRVYLSLSWVAQSKD